MTEEQRKLAAIVFTDMVGYTALSQRDETHALHLLQKHDALLRSSLVKYHGKEIKTMGDAFLMEFESALDATRCAVDIQQQLHSHNLNVSSDDRINVRIGIHLGDVLHRGLDVLGDAVNIASRVESLADPSGICITEPVYFQVKNKIAETITKLPSQKLKNVEIPLTLYRIALPWDEPFTSQTPEQLFVTTRVAVLPFQNISPDPNDSYFADGLTEELITALSQVRGIRVIAKTSTSRYNGTKKGIPQIGSELQVGSILGGSVRKSANKIRVTAQLIDVSSQEHLWTSQYDRDLTDIFAIQSDIAKNVAEGLKVTLLPTEQIRIETKSTGSTDAHVAYLRGRSRLQNRSEKSVRAAQEQFELAIKHDPTYARAYSGLADVYNLLEEYLFAPKDECREKRRSYVTKAIALDPNLPEARVSLASLLLDDYRFAEAELQFRQAIALNPSYATAHHWYGLCLRELGRLDEAMSEFLIAEELDPLTSVIRYLVCDVFLCRGSLDESFARIQKMREIDPESPFTYSALVDYHLLKGEFERALDSAKELKKLWSASGLDSNLAYIFAVTDRQKEAKEILARLEKEFERGPISPAEPIAWGYVGLNDLDACFKWLERAFDRREKIFGTIRFFPLYRKVRDDQRFNELLRRANLPLESTRTLGS